MSRRHYDENSIESLDPLEHVRLRPAMYISDIGSKGVKRLYNENLGNALDEANVPGSGCNTIYTTINATIPEFIIEDNGRGIPIGKLHDSCAVMNTSGKYSGENYECSIGQNGVGLKAVNALSEYMDVTVLRDGMKSTISYSKGKVTKAQETKPFVSDHTGTRFRFKPDATILKDVNIDLAEYETMLKLSACINRGVRIKYIGIDKHGVQKNKEFYSEHGPSQYLVEEILPKHKPIIKPITFEVKDGKSKGLVVSFTWCSNVRKPYILSFVNGISTENHGFHVSGFYKGLTAVIMKDLKQQKKLPPKLVSYVSNDDILEGIAGLVVGKHNNPLFDGQTKDRFASEDFELFAKDAIIMEMDQWILSNKSAYQTILEGILVNANARYEASKARELVKQSASTTSSLNLSDPKKFKNCSCKDPRFRELHMVEGDSAGGSAAQSKDNEYQALYKLGGVPTNTYKMDKMDKILVDKNGDPSVIGDLVKILGCGWGKTFDINKINYHKIVIDTDGDSDGHHIRGILVAFFFKYYRPLVEAGYLYVSNPPLYRLQYKSTKLYVVDTHQYYQILDHIALNCFDFFAGTKQTQIKDTETIKVFLYHLRGYCELMDSLSKQTGVHPHILEALVICGNKVYNHTSIKLNTFPLNLVDTPDGRIVEGFYIDTYYRCIIDEFLLKDTLAPVAKYLSNIYYSNVYIKAKNDKRIIGPSPYIIDNIIKSSITKKINISRYKGLGEMNPDELWHTVLQPSSRFVTRITLEDEDTDNTYVQAMDMLIGNDLALRKEYYKQYM